MRVGVLRMCMCTRSSVGCVRIGAMGIDMREAGASVNLPREAATIVIFGVDGWIFCFEFKRSRSGEDNSFDMIFGIWTIHKTPDLIQLMLHVDSVV